MRSDETVDVIPGLDGQHTRKTIERRAGGELAVHHWRPLESHAHIVYVHGLQSHAGWSWELAMDFAARGFAFSCLDRLGSGLSGGDHGEFPPAERAIDDYAGTLEDVLESANGPVIAVGHCLGGSVLAATLAARPSVTGGLQSVAMVSAWLGRLHDTLDKRERHEVRRNSSTRRRPVAFSARDFTPEPSYREFIDNDPLAIREISERSRGRMVELEEVYEGHPGLGLRSQFICARADPIVDVERALSRHQRFFASTSVHLLDSVHHYLPFTVERPTMVDIIAAELRDHDR